jgi:FkbM family methyltransferase
MPESSTWLNVMRRVTPRSVRNLLRNPRATSDWLWQESSYRLGRVATVALRDDWTVRCHPMSASAFRVIRDDPDQSCELASFVQRCTPGMIFFDIGASFGAFTLAALHYGGPESRAVAVDPSPLSNRVLRINIDLAGAHDRVQVIEAAVGNVDGGSLSMLATGPSGDHYWLGTDEDRPDVQRVPLRTIPSLITQTGLMPTRLKIDVEGFEYEVLQGAVDFLRTQRPLLFLELHVGMIRRRDASPERVLTLLNECGYVHFEHQGRQVAPEEFLGREIARLICTP